MMKLIKIQFTKIQEYKEAFMKIFGIFYDYYYVKQQLKKAKNSNIKSIAIGSSYGIHGIDQSLINNGEFVNLSMISQDFYYGIKLAYSALKENNNIKTIYLCSGYYSFYLDMSLCKNDGVPRVANLYNRIFKDKHNCIQLPERVTINFNIENFINKDKLENFLGEILCKMFGDMYYPTTNPETFTKFTQKMDENDRFIMGKKRAILHNHLITHDKTFNENISIINNFNEFCIENNINLVIIIFPVTKYYKAYLLPKFESDYKLALNSMENNINFLDLNKLNIYENEDFTDTDHLNLKGAIKTSMILNQLKL